MKHFVDYDEYVESIYGINKETKWEDSTEEEDTLEDLIEYVLENLDPNYKYKDFVVDRLTNLEGEYERTDAAVTYFQRTDLDKTKWKFCYNLIIPVVDQKEGYVPVVIPNEHMDDVEFEVDEDKMMKTLMLDIMRNTDLIEEDKPKLSGENITTETIQIGGLEIYFWGIPHIEVSFG